MFGSQRTTEAKRRAMDWASKCTRTGSVSSSAIPGPSPAGRQALLIHVKTGIVLALTTNLGYATAVSPPPPRKGTPDPPMLLLPFIQGR